MQITMYLNGELTPGTKVLKMHGGTEYQVHLPTGTKLTVKLQGIARSTFLNLYVTGSATDYQQTEGNVVHSLICSYVVIYFQN